MTSSGENFSTPAAAAASIDITPCVSTKPIASNLIQFNMLGAGDALPPFTSISKLPVGEIFTVSKIIKRDYGVDGCIYPGVQLFLNENTLRTALPSRFYTYFEEAKPEEFESFKNTVKTVRVDGFRNTKNGKMVLVSFPNLTED